ncbi:hypothetical protein DFH08DRAFT_810027 [Mycena albidolilacea]|uniref:Uncharacterized protein n=1 Tax=Mycena albidolilacea TaxID=1033008 RepID=A0AAD6ZYY3_9AGAR|nr:hypothetical protein DFH08DRAFT_810027 [Mycena albidolilacea]
MLKACLRPVNFLRCSVTVSRTEQKRRCTLHRSATEEERKKELKWIRIPESTERIIQEEEEKAAIHMGRETVKHSLNDRRSPTPGKDRKDIHVQQNIDPEHARVKQRGLLAPCTHTHGHTVLPELLDDRGGHLTFVFHEVKKNQNPPSQARRKKQEMRNQQHTGLAVAAANTWNGKSTGRRTLRWKRELTMLAVVALKDIRQDRTEEYTAGVLTELVKKDSVNT